MVPRTDVEQAVRGPPRRLRPGRRPRLRRLTPPPVRPARPSADPDADRRGYPKRVRAGSHRYPVRPMRIGIVGATGQVGGVMRAVLAERQFPVDELRLFASARSAGRRLPWGDGEIEVEDAETADYSGLDIVLFSAGGATSKALAPRVAEAGAVVVDNSSAWRMDPDVPARGARGQRPRPRLASPRTSSPTPTARRWSPCRCSSRSTPRPACARLVVSTYQAVSGGGLAGTGRARGADPQGRRRRPGARHVGQRGRAPGRREVPGAHRLQRHPLRRLPRRRRPATRPTRSRSSATRAARSSSSPTSRSSVTCVRVPVYTGHSLSINAPGSPTRSAPSRPAASWSRPRASSSPTSPRR